MIPNPPLELIKYRESAMACFVADLSHADSDTTVKIVCRAYANLIGPAAMGPVWAIDAKPVTKLMWNTHAKTQMAFVRGLIGFLPDPPATNLEVN